MGSLICRVELNKEKDKGIIVKVENKDDSITHTIVLKDKQIITTSTGGSDTSTITQDPSSIKIKVKTFELDAETITCKSSKSTEHSSGTTYDIKASGNLGMKTDQNLSASASANAEFKGNMTTVKGQLTNVQGNLVKLG